MGSILKSIELNREFVSVTEIDADPEAIQLQLAFARHRGEDLGWKQLLEHRYVVVLGEAGTGKSVEFQRQVARLRNEGAHAFFLELASLAKSMVHAIRDQNTLDSWRATDDPAYFFLDSLDEAKLARSTLEQALLCLKHALRDEWARVRLIVSCRVSDWSTNDLETLSELVPKPKLECESESAKALHFVRFVGLDATRVKLLAEAHDVADVDAFWEAVEDQDIGALVERPLDVEEMAEFWNAQSPNRLGTLHEITEYHIEKNLQESQAKRRAKVAPTRILEGALALAGLATISRRVSFLLPGEKPDDASLDPADVLRDWSPDELNELMSRGLFDPSTYGRVRFHHRDIQDYLAAKWLEKLAENGVPRTKVEDVLIRSTANGTTIPRHLRNTVAWLCLNDVLLCKKVTELCPATLLSYGDAAGLSDAQRIHVLRRYVAQYGDRTRRNEHFPAANLRRFASTSLEGAVGELLRSDDVPTEMKEHLFRMVRSARLVGNKNEALRFALDDTTPLALRCAAMRAVETAGTPGDHLRLIGLLHTPTRWEHDLAAAFVSCLYSDAMGISGLLRLLKRMTANEQSSSFEYELRDALRNGGNVSSRHEALQAMLEFLAPPTVVKTGIRANRSWLLPSLAALVEQSLHDTPDGSETVVRAVELLGFCTQNLPDVHVYDFPKILTAFPEFRRRWFWSRVARYSAANGRRPSFFELRRSLEPWTELSASDVDWLKADVVDCALPKVDRLLTLNALASLLELKKLEPLVLHTPFLKRRCERMANPVVFIHRTGRDAELARASQPNYRMWARRREARENRVQAKLADDRRTLLNQLEQLRDGSALRNLHTLAERLNPNSDDVVPLVETFGEEVAEAAELGWRAFWRTHWCLLPHEGPGRRAILLRVKLGLAGIAAERRAKSGLSHFSDADVECAVRYATRANKVPDWLDELAELRPSAVVRVLGPCIREDFNAGERTHGVLSSLTVSGPNVQRACIPLVLALLCGQRGARRRIRGRRSARARGPRRQRVTAQYAPGLARPITWAVTACIDLLVVASAQDLLPIATVSAKCRAAGDEPERFAAWWCVWLHIQPLQAVEALEELLRGRISSVSRVLVETCCARVQHYVDRHSLNSRLAFHALDALEALVPLVYEFVRSENDHNHVGTYSPDRRDHAERGRGILWNALTGFHGEKATAALYRVADHPAMASSRDFLLSIADERVVSDAVLRDSPVVDEILSIYRVDGSSSMKTIGEKMTDPIDVAIITMKPEEHEAVLDRMGTIHARSGKNRNYRVSKVTTSGGGRCNVAVTRAVDQGNIHAVSAATECDADLSPRFILVVGIAGTSPNADALLGDVVVSKYIGNFTLEDTGVGSDVPNYDATGGGLHIEAEKIVGDLRVIERGIFESWFPEVSRPGIEGVFTTDNVSWNERVKKAVDKSGANSNPCARPGTVVSSDRLMKDPRILQKWEGTLRGLEAIDMESAGVREYCSRNNIPMLTVRGISDIVGWKRDEGWTLYACHSAAAYALHLIRAGVFSNYT